MNRRQILQVGLASSAVLTVAAGAAWWFTDAPRTEDGSFSESTRHLFGALAPTVLAGALPADPAARKVALQALMQRLEATIQGMPPAVQGELDQLLLLLNSAPGRRGIASLAAPWQQATPTQLHEALQAMRHSTLSVRQQVFHALRDLCNAAYFAAPQTWQTVGYPGPLKV